MAWSMPTVVVMRADLVFALAAVAMTLHGCGGGGGGNTPSGPPAPAPPGPMPPFTPIKSISYEALPIRSYVTGTPLPAEDMAQEGYSPQWGPDGRDDLGMIKTLGGNAVQLHHSLGLESLHKHGNFLDRAKDIGLHVIAGFHTQMTCADFDCFDSWKKATLQGFKDGFLQDGGWHPAVAMLQLQDRPDNLNFVGSDLSTCKMIPQNKCWLKAVLSAMDGVLSAEKEQKVINSTVSLTVAWSMASRDSIDGQVRNGVGYFGFRDIMVGAKDPMVADYNPRVDPKELEDAFTKRWIHSLNVEASTDVSAWKWIQGLISPVYQQFLPTPWFISGFDLNQQKNGQITDDLKAMDAEAKLGGAFLGVSVDEFQKRYDVNGTDSGLFDLGSGTSPIKVTGDVCEEDVRTGSQKCHGNWPVNCLEEDKAVKRASAVATAWKGAVRGRGLYCSSTVAEELVV